MVSVIIIGINGWEEYTRPLVADIWNYEPDVNLRVIDNESDPPYPNKGDHIIRLDKRMSYAEAINTSVATVPDGWIIVLNNDVKCDGKFVDSVEALDKNVIYGMTLYSEPTFDWLSSWIIVMHKSLFDKVGEFDTRFEVCAYEDIDYCYRAKQIGIQTKKVDLPFHHYGGKTRWSLPGYEAIRLQNRDKFEQKHNIHLDTKGYKG